MFRESRLHPWLLTFLCVVLLVVRVGGVHLHLCFDGTEPPASFHLFDEGPHHAESGVNATHQDADIAAVGDMLSKSGKFNWDLPLVLLVAVFLWALLRAPRYFVSAFSALVVCTAPLFLRPPLRGPPLLTSL